MTERSHKGLVLRDVKVTRGGKTFTQKRWVKAGNDEPEEKKPSKKEVKGKESFKIGSKLSLMGKDLTIEKVSESEKTVKLSDGKVYTFDAIDKGSKIKKPEPSVKDLKIRKKKPEKEIKRVIPSGAPITEKNAEETLKIGARITMRGKPATITNRNGNILEYTNQDGTKNLGSLNGLIDEGATVRDEDKNDLIDNKKRQKIINKAEKKVESREKQFDKIRKPSKKIGAKTTSLGLKMGEKIIIDGKELSVTRKDKYSYFFDSGKIYAAKTIHRITEKKPLVSGNKVSANYKFTDDKKQDAKISETINKLDNLMLDGISLDDAVKKVIKGKKGSLTTTNINLPSFNKESKKIINDTLTKIDKYISPKYKESGLEINLIENTTGRSYAISATNTISIANTNTMDSILMHEVGHIMENNHGDNHKVIDDFLRSRTGNLSDQKSMNKVCPNCGYRDDEMTCKNHFIDPYVGSIRYKTVKGGDIDIKETRSSEILSMGMQKFNDEESMRSFYRQDKEHFALTLSIMAGDFIE